MRPTDAQAWTGFDYSGTDAPPLLEIVVGLLVRVDIRHRLVQRLLRVRTGQDVLRGLGERGGDERIAGCRRPDQRVLGRDLPEDVVLSALLVAGNHGGGSV